MKRGNQFVRSRVAEAGVEEKTAASWAAVLSGRGAPTCCVEPGGPRRGPGFWVLRTFVSWGQPQCLSQPHHRVGRVVPFPGSGVSCTAFSVTLFSACSLLEVMEPL